MNLEYTYKKTEKIKKYLQKLEIAKKVVNKIKTTSEVVFSRNLGIFKVRQLTDGAV